MLSTALFLLTVGAIAAAIAVRRLWTVPAVVALAVLATGTFAAWVSLCGTYDLRKVLGLLAMPIGLAWLAVLVLAWRRTEQRRPAAGLWAVWVAIAIAGNGLVGGGLLTWLEAPFAVSDPFAGPPLDAVVVLGGGVRSGADGRPVLGASGDRAVLGLRLYLSGRTPILVTTGPEARGRGAPVPSVPDLTERLWRELGVPEAAIVTVTGPRTTSEEMDALRDLVERRGWRRVGVVTSGYHLRRALRLARRRGLTLEPLPAGRVGPVLRIEPQALIPNGEGCVALHRGCWELLGQLAAR